MDLEGRDGPQQTDSADSGEHPAPAFGALPSTRASRRRQPRHRTRHFRTRAEADRWLATAAADRVRGTWVDPRAGAVTVAAFGEEWLEGKALLAPKTLELYRYLVRSLIIPTLGDVELSAL